MTSTLQQNLIARIRIDISTHKITCYRELSAALQIANLVGEGGLFPSMKPTDRVTVAGFNALVEMLPAAQERHTEHLKLSGKFHGEHELDKYNWLPSHNPRQSAVLYPHQRKDSKDIVYRLFIENRRSVLLDSDAGNGKTFVFFQIVRWLVDKGWFKDCYSPWKCLVITKSAQETLVSQTEHVAEDFFGLSVPREVKVLSYDALRSGKGLSTMIKKTRVHRDGALVDEYEWVEGLNPKLIIVDECQSARRDEAIQSKIIQKIADIKDESIKVIFSSATWATRISEMKYLITNLGLEV